MNLFGLIFGKKPLPWRSAPAQIMADLDKSRAKLREKTAPLTSRRDATTAALSGRPDPSVDYGPLVDAWKKPVKKHRRHKNRNAHH